MKKSSTLLQYSKGSTNRGKHLSSALYAALVTPVRQAYHDSGHCRFSALFATSALLDLFPTGTLQPAHPTCASRSTTRWSIGMRTAFGTWFLLLLRNIPTFECYTVTQDHSLVSLSQRSWRYLGSLFRFRDCSYLCAVLPISALFLLSTLMVMSMYCDSVRLLAFFPICKPWEVFKYPQFWLPHLWSSRALVSNPNTFIICAQK